MTPDVMDVTRRNPRARASLPVVLAVVGALLGAGVLAGCSGDGTDVSCSVDVCTLTMDRGVDASASVLGVKVQLVGVDNDQVTVDVGGNRLTLPASGASQSSGGFDVSVQRVTADQVVLQISRN